MRTRLIEITKESESVCSFVIDKFFVFEPGQWITVKLRPGLQRDLTISSSPTEHKIQFTTKFRETSEFKKYLWNLRVGDSLEISQPNGHFLLHNTKPKLFLYKGMGITPFRSMVKYIQDKKITIDYFLSTGKLPDDYRDREWYICGPPKFVDQMIIKAKKLGMVFYTEDFPGY